MLPKISLKPLSMGTPTMMQSDDTVSGPHHKRKGPALLEHPLASGPGPRLLAHRPWSLQARGEAQSRHSQELGSLGHRQAPLLASVSLAAEAAPALPSNTAPLKGQPDVSRLRGQGVRAGATCRWKSRPIFQMLTCTHPVWAPTVSPQRRLGQRNPQGVWEPCTAGPVAWLLRQQFRLSSLARAEVS